MRRGPNHGGPRKGAGRPKGAANKRTREAADKLMADGGITPLEVMVQAMRAFWDEAQAAEDQTDRRGLMAMACEQAARAAPYLHPRLQAVTVDADVSGELTVRWES